MSNPQSTTYVGAPLNPSAPTELAPQQTRDIEVQAVDLETQVRVLQRIKECNRTVLRLYIIYLSFIPVCGCNAAACMMAGYYRRRFRNNVYLSDSMI